jgi:hypothetical protein
MSSDAIDEGKQRLETVPSGFSETFQKQDEQGIHRQIIPMISNALEFLSDRQWSGYSDRLPISIESMYSNLLEQAQTAVEEARYADAVALISGIPKNSQHYEIAQQLQNDWSQELLQQSTKFYQQGDLVRALSVLKTIPPTSQQHDRAVELHERWSNHAVWFERALAAREAQDWNGAIVAIEALEGTPLYHSVLVQEILQESISSMLRPNDRLMQIASANLPTTSAIPPSLPSPSGLPSDSSSTSPIEPLPSPGLPVDVNQALEWTQPSPSPVSPPTFNEIPIANQNALPTSDPLTVKPAIPQTSHSFNDPKPFSRQATTP